jgi:SAM-dependent methyltransferase
MQEFAFTEVDYNELGITPRQIDEIISHDPLSHDILQSYEAVEAMYQPLTANIPAPTPTIPSPPQPAPALAVKGYHHLPDIAAFVEYVDIGQHDSVLDLGTGPGWVLRQLRQVQIKQDSNQSGPLQAPEFVGVDACLSMVALARNLSQSQGPGYGHLRFVHDNIISLRSITNRFNVITCRWTFQHLPQFLPQVALARWKSLLAPGGRIVFDFQGDTPIPCTMDIVHPGMYDPFSGIMHPTRGYVLRKEELAALDTAFKTLLAAAQLQLVAGKPIKIGGIDNHDQALCRAEHFATTGGGYDDITAGPEALCGIFRDFIEREPDQKERSLLTLHYMEWCRDQATASQPEGPQGPAAMLYTKNLALVAAV